MFRASRSNHRVRRTHLPAAVPHESGSLNPILDWLACDQPASPAEYLAHLHSQTDLVAATFGATIRPDRQQELASIIVLSEFASASGLSVGELLCLLPAAAARAAEAVEWLETELKRSSCAVP